MQMAFRGTAPYFNTMCQVWIDVALRGVAARLLGGSEGMLPREKFTKWCNLVRFGAFFHNFFTLNNSKYIHCYT